MEEHRPPFQFLSARDRSPPSGTPPKASRERNLPKNKNRNQGQDQNYGDTNGNFLNRNGVRKRRYLPHRIVDWLVRRSPFYTRKFTSLWIGFFHWSFTDRSSDGRRRICRPRRVRQCLLCRPPCEKCYLAVFVEINDEVSRRVSHEVIPIFSFLFFSYFFPKPLGQTPRLSNLRVPPHFSSHIFLRVAMTN